MRLICRLCPSRATWRGWIPKPGCKAKVLIPAEVCDRHRGALITRGLMTAEPLTS